jgi:hypothetical protein
MDRFKLWQHRIVGIPLQNNSIAPPFFIIGSGRSGSTLLRRMLFAHPKLHIPPENHLLGSAVRNFRRISRQPWRKVVYQTLHHMADHPDFGAFDLSVNTVARQIVSTPIRRRSLAFIIDQLYRYHARPEGKQTAIWGDKTPLNIFYTQDILEVFPRARFIHLIRDGYDVTASYLRMRRYADIRSAALRWRASVRAGQYLVQTLPQQCINVRYEQLVSEPGVVLANICHFLEIPFIEEMIHSEAVFDRMGDTPRRAHHAAVAQPVTRDAIGKGHRDLSPEDQKLLQELIGAEMLRLNYQVT